MTQTHATAYAVVLGSAEHGFSLATLCKTPECAREAVSIFEGMPVLGLATIALEPEPIIGMTYRLGGGAVPAPRTAAQPAGITEERALVSGGGEVLTDDEVIDRCDAAGLKWLEPDNVLPDGTIDLDGFPGSFDMVTMAEMRALFAALSTPQLQQEAE